MPVVNNLKAEKEYKKKYEKAMNRVFAILDKEEDDMIPEPSKVKNKIITLDEKACKNTLILNLIQQCTELLSVVSCDPKSDQLVKILTKCKEAKLNVFELAKCKKAQFTKMLMCVAQEKPVTILMLNTPSQIRRLSRIIKKILDNEIELEKYICIHDEVEMINKADDIADLNNHQLPETHREWILHFASNKGFFSRIARVWVASDYEKFSQIHFVSKLKT